MMVEWDGVVMGFVEWHCSKRKPLAARESITGVDASSRP
jgi:hypothetical protein